MSQVQTLTVEEDDGELRLDRWFKRHFPELAHGRLEKLLRTGQVRVNGKRAAGADRIGPGDAIRVPPLPKPDTPRPEPKARPVDERAAKELRDRVIYRDRDILAIDKPAGLAVQGGTKTAHHLDGMLDALKFDAKDRPRLVHRLDRDTSGVLVLGRTAAATAHLAALFRGRDLKKIYWAVVVGAPVPEYGDIRLPLAKRIGRPGEGEERMVVDEEEGQSARTLFRTLDAAGNKVALLELEPLTGRTHQLRVHCAELGTPILGDGKYGGAPAILPIGEFARSLHLHARRLEIPNKSGKAIVIEAKLPRHMRDTLSFFGLNSHR
ncbi:MAG: RluA family pseudouridine synthase [Rhodospirillales bacterium]